MRNRDEILKPKCKILKYFRFRNWFLGFSSFVVALFVITPLPLHAASPVLTYRYNHHLFEVYPDANPNWWGEEEVFLYGDREIRPLAEWRVDGDFRLSGRDNNSSN